ncbi:MAG: hypothetical protein Fues2KO_36450 [Fuerstiella sp.]
MQPHRLPFHIWAILLVPALTAAAQPPQIPEEPVLNELGTRDEEPRIALPEHRAQTPFTTVSQTRRKASQDPLVSLCQQAVDTTTRRMLSTDQHTPWQMMHALLGLREDFQLLHNGQPVSGLKWISEGQVFTNEHWFEKTQHGGRAHPYSVPYAFEGHANQFLAILSMCGLGLDEEFGTADGTITMRDMINHAQMTLSEKDEPTWTLWALSRYLPPTATWRNAQGELWSIERLVQIQTAKPMRGAPCGGTHGLFALAHARNVYLRQGKPLRGVWLMAERKIRQHIYTARMQQNSNGTLSSNFFRGRQYDRDFNKRMASAGHILEFLMIALPQKELNQRWVRRAIEATARDLLNNRKAFVKCSPLYHSVNALNIYLDRVNPRVPTEDPSEELAATTEPTRTAQRPQPADSTTPGLKSVPATSISQSREKPSDESKAGAAEPKNDDIAQRQEDEQPKASAPAASKPAKSENADKAEEGWSATPEARRSKIAVESKGGDSDATDPQPSAESTKSIPAVEEPQRLLPPKERPAADAKPADDPPTSDTTTTETPDADKPQDDSAEPPELMIPTEAEAAADAKSGDGEAATESDVKTSEDPSPTEPAEAESKTGEALLETSTDTKASKSATDAAEPTALDDKPSEQPETLEPPAPLPTLKATPDPDDVTSDGSVPIGINRQFLDPDLNPNDWLQRFEIESREIFAARGAILRSLQLRPNMAVADVGTGTGLFVGLLSDAVGPKGHVYAIDISPRLVDFVHRRVTAEELDNVSVVRNDQHGLQLGNQKVDRILVCDTYHHFEYHEDMLKSMYRHLRPGGEVILIDFERIPQTSRTWVLEHVRADKQTFREEFLSAGFEFVEEVTVPEFRENYLLRFRRPIDAE